VREMPRAGEAAHCVLSLTRRILAVPAAPDARLLPLRSAPLLPLPTKLPSSVRAVAGGSDPSAPQLNCRDKCRCVNGDAGIGAGHTHCCYQTSHIRCATMADRGVSGGTVSYEAAIESLRSMFPDVDVAVVEAILQANRE
jgi:hypothetical protein